MSGRRSPLLAIGQAAPDVVDAVRILEEQPRLPPFTVAELTAIDTAGLEQGMTAYCTNETGGEVPVFFDGSQWRRVTDRAVIS